MTSSYSAHRIQRSLKHLLLTVCALIAFLLPSSFLAASSNDMQVTVVAFSFDRAMQLYAYLESVEKYFTGIDETHVIYRVSNQEHEDAYLTVATRFPKVHFHKQTASPQDGFKSLTLSSVFSETSSSNYMMFSVDDMIATDYVNLEECTHAMVEHNAWSFLLRLGKNITFCYMENRATPVPQGQDVGDTMFSWNFWQGTGDWGYPNNVDMSIYRKNDIAAFLKTEDYVNPNTLEATWQRWVDGGRKGLCFQTTKNINIPLNLVNELWVNRCNYSFTVAELLAKFQQGLKIDINAFYQVRNVSPHVDYAPTFISRN